MRWDNRWRKKWYDVWEIWVIMIGMLIVASIVCCSLLRG